MFSTKKLTFCAILGGMYAALTLVLAPISFGVVQLRLSEALCALPFLVPCSAWGLFAGCLIANLMTGNLFDVILGSLATLAAGLLTGCIGRRFRAVSHDGKGGRRLSAELLGLFMPVIVNAIVVGAVLTYAYEGQQGAASLPVLGVNMLWLGVCEAAVMYPVGLPLLHLMGRSGRLSSLLSQLED